ncbi:MAG: type IV secretory system conjugative DNA transfer family protein [Acidilobus sp.]
MNPSYAFDVFLAVIATATAALMIRNLRASRELRLSLGVRHERGQQMSVYVDGKRLAGIAYVADDVPREGSDLPLRLARLARSSRLSVTFISSMYSVSKSSLIKELEEEIRKADFAYTATRHVKYRERLSFLEGLYKEVLHSQVPYVGSLSFIVWVPPGDREAELNAEAFKELVEAEAQVRLRRVNASDLSQLLSASEPTWLSEGGHAIIVNREDINDESGVVIGEDVDGPGNLVIMRWPYAFRVHVGVFGPTGRGKTVMLSGVAAQLISRHATLGDPKAIVVVDPKGDLASMLKDVADSYITPLAGDCVPMPRTDGVAAKLIESSRETGEGASVSVCPGSLDLRGLVVYDLRGLPNELRNVYGSLLVSSIAVSASEGASGGRVVLMLDEAWRFSRGSAVHMEFALREGRSKGLYVIYATQLPSDVGRTVIDNTGYKFVFGGFTSYYVELGAQLGVQRPEVLKSLPVGHAVMIDEVGRTREVRVLDFTKLLKNLTPSPTGEGGLDGKELKAAEGREGLTDVQEP